MPVTIPVQTKEAGRKRSARWALALAFVVIMGVTLIYRRSPSFSRLSGPHGEGNGFLQQGVMYWVSGPGSAILTQPVTGNKARTLVDEGPQRWIQLMDPARTFDPDTVVYSTYASIHHPEVIRQASDYSAEANKLSLGQFRAAGNRLTAAVGAGEKRGLLPPPAPVPLSETPILPIHIRAVNVRTGAVRDLATLTAWGNSKVVLGKQLYWIKSLPDDTVRVTRPDQAWWDEITGHSELWVTSLVDGSSRRLHTGLPSSTRLLDGKEGVFWMEPNPYPNRHQNLCYWREKDSRLYRITGYAEDMNRARPVEDRGRLYWFACDNPGPYINGTRWSADWLVSANLDGSDQRKVLSIKGTKYRVEFQRSPQGGGAGLLLHEGNFYCLLNDPSLIEPRLSLCRLRPERADPIEIVYQFPKSAHFDALDEGYVYFWLPEQQHRTFWGTLTSDPADVRRVSTPCRVELPGNSTISE